MMRIKLPFWLGGPEFKKLIVAATTWWNRVERWVRWPLTQLDPLLCHLTILDLLAWQRDIDRFPDEPESLYRLRIKHALINAQQAGSKAGFIAIFERLGLGYLEIEERTDAVNWDMVTLNISDAQLAASPDLLQHVIVKYGRTCRRYELTVLNTIDVTIDSRATGHSWNLDIATL